MVFAFTVFLYPIPTHPSLQTPLSLNIWICNPFDDIPEEGPPLRYHTLCRVLVERGHDVTWWSANFSHRRKARRVAGSPDPKTSFGFDLRLLPVRPYNRNVSPQRFLSHRDYARGFLKVAQAGLVSGTLCKPDRIVVSMPPLETADAAFALRKQFGGEVILDIMDAWPETFARLLPGPSAIRKHLAGWIFASFHARARRAYRQADRIAGVAEQYLELARRAGASQPMYRCYHGTNLSASCTPRERATGEPLRLVYIGAMERSYDLTTVLETLAEGRRQGLSLTLDLAGSGSRAEALHQRARKLGLLDGPAACVNIHGQLNREALTQLLAHSHLGLVPMDPASEVAVPYKAADYAAAGLPLVSCLGNELGHLIRQHDAGSEYTLGQPHTLLQALKTYCVEPDRLRHHSHGARLLAEAHFNRPSTYQSLAAFIEGPP